MQMHEASGVRREEEASNWGHFVNDSNDGPATLARTDGDDGLGDALLQRVGFLFP